MGMQSPKEPVSTRLRRIAELAKNAPDMAFTSLNHHIDLDWLREAYRRISKKAAPGIDGVTACEYEANLEENLADLLNRAKSGRYRAPAVRRVHIPKGASGKETRPIGIPCLEDRVLQKAVAMLLDAIYEPLFKDCSYGFRKGRSAHQALRVVWKGLQGFGRGGWVIDLDISKYFDTIPHYLLREILRQRVRDGVLVRLLGKWMKAGVMEEGRISYPGSGTPQGGVISPILANAYLHEVLDTWFDETVKPRLTGRAFLVRYADDAVLAFTEERDARRVLKVLPKRFGKYGLTLHPEKTRIVDFRRPGSGKDGPRPPKGRSFPFLGFTHHWGKSRKGRWIVKQKTAKDRFTRSMGRIRQWCRRNRHAKVGWQAKMLRKKLVGHYNYYGITGNIGSLCRFFHEVKWTWFKWLRRRGQRRRLNWERFIFLLEVLKLPTPKIKHSYARA